MTTPEDERASPRDAPLAEMIMAVEAAHKFVDATGAEMIAMLSNGTEHWAPRVRAMADFLLKSAEKKHE
jgi:hypothetical protein